MDTVFNINRFWNLAKKEFVTYRKQYLFVICGLVAYYIIAALISLYDSNISRNMVQLMPVIYVLLIICAAPFLDKNLKESNISFYLSTPVSTFERFLMMWCKNVIIFPLMMFIISYTLNYVSVIIFGKDYGSLPLFLESLSNLYTLLAIQSVFMFGYIYFKKRAFIKTLIAMAIFLAVVMSISQIIITQFYPEVLQLGDSSLRASSKGNYNILSRDSIERAGLTVTFAYDVARSIILLIFPLGMWVLSYFRIRETEI
ncbi:hypothetical protein D0T84_17265 [Dysgonomonas sp. 521]|uniref:hypothetical protein n=1 Tax=Dysgonomonas sp. 521 TaxID=2302932 RepID=UPI0013D7E0A3|nr:hypothetical protein [Dysgonomonas sp. 521]NDV96648.1 hypothetical protein [Dysgonomonas sp. 521]